MFDYPLPIPHRTLYQDYGLEPEATTDEIKAAKADARAALIAEQKAVESALATIYVDVPKLKEIETQIERLQTARIAAGNSHESGEIERSLNKAQQDLAKLETEAQTRDPRFKELRERARELDRKLTDLNQVPIMETKTRSQYDRSNPPLELLRLANCQRNELFERSKSETALAVLRSEVAEFIARQGEAVSHPSDLTRQDFTADFVYCDLLDGA